MLISNMKPKLNVFFQHRLLVKVTSLNINHVIINLYSGLFIAIHEMR